MTKKPKRHEQQRIAEETATAQERRQLRSDIATLKRLPRDFRDITAGSKAWESFARITKRREEMETWDNGPILYFGKLNKHEEMILGSQNELRHWSTVPFGSENWIAVIQHVTSTQCSWIYLPDEESKTIDALNVLFSRFDYNVRAKKRLMSEMSGKPVGVVR